MFNLTTGVFLRALPPHLTPAQQPRLTQHLPSTHPCSCLDPPLPTVVTSTTVLQNHHTLFNIRQSFSAPSFCCWGRFGVSPGDVPSDPLCSCPEVTSWWDHTVCISLHMARKGISLPEANYFLCFGPHNTYGTRSHFHTHPSPTCRVPFLCLAINSF